MSRRPAPPGGWPPPAERDARRRAVDLTGSRVRSPTATSRAYPEDLERYGELAREWEIHDTQHCSTGRSATSRASSTSSTRSPGWRACWRRGSSRSSTSPATSSWRRTSSPSSSGGGRAGGGAATGRARLVAENGPRPIARSTPGVLVNRIWSGTGRPGRGCRTGRGSPAAGGEQVDASAASVPGRLVVVDDEPKCCSSPAPGGKIAMNWSLSRNERRRRPPVSDVRDVESRP